MNATHCATDVSSKSIQVEDLLTKTDMNNEWGSETIFLILFQWVFHWSKYLWIFLYGIKLQCCIFFNLLISTNLAHEMIFQLKLLEEVIPNWNMEGAVLAQSCQKHFVEKVWRLMTKMCWKLAVDYLNEVKTLYYKSCLFVHVFIYILLPCWQGL